MLRFIWNTSIRIRTFMRVWMPTNILLDTLRSRRGLKWGVPAMLLAGVYFAIAYWCTTLIASGAPGWLHLVVLVCIYNAFKFLIFGPISLARLIKVRRQERRARRTETLPSDGTSGSPTGHEALPGDEHGPTYLGRTSGARQA
ncbi:sulfate permease [Micropruina sp.]|uniref:sulfate permease n=1 Tax=Micropruina sp. TaxID=2737536 RepID=UPI0039E5D505